MTATVAQLGARALRELGLGIVAQSSRPADGAAVTQAEIVRRVMRNQGIVVPENQRPAQLGAVGQTEIADRTLRRFGVNPIANPGDPLARTTPAEIAIRALRNLGINPADHFQQSAIIYTFRDVATGALRRLGIISAEETPALADQAYAEERALSVHDMLAQRDFVSWDDFSIPAAAFEAYVALTANLAAPAFGKPQAVEVAAAAQEMIRTQALSGGIAFDRAVRQVTSVHDMLTAEGLADWDLNLLPDAVADAYVTLVSAAMAPIYGKAVEGQALEAAKAQVRRIVLSGVRGRGIAVAKVLSAHDALVQAGVVSWPVSAVPVAFAEDYVTLAASMLAPVYGQPQADVFGEVVTRLRAAGQVRDAEERATERVQGLYAELNAMGLVSFAANAIPAAMADAMITMATVMDGIEAGKMDNAAMEAGFQRIRQIAMAGPAGQALAEQKVRAVHASLEARGRVRWTLFNIPTYAEEPYVLMAASLLAPSFGVRVDPARAPGAEADLLRIISLPSRREPVVATYL